MQLHLTIPRCFSLSRLFLKEIKNRGCFPAISLTIKTQDECCLPAVWRKSLLWKFVKFDDGNPLVELATRIIPIYCIYLKDPLFPRIAPNLDTKQQQIVMIL